jgi:hypothetical protein
LDIAHSMLHMSDMGLCVALYLNAAVSQFAITTAKAKLYILGQESFQYWTQS